MRPWPRKIAGDRSGDSEEQRAANAKRPPWSGTRERKLQG
ncbi:hypothetical protein B4092_4907 [Bacillus licheniformis]|nr:hypothetical protein B4092_4907 [Bacillus licheniformis]